MFYVNIFETAEHGSVRLHSSCSTDLGRLLRPKLIIFISIQAFYVSSLKAILNSKNVANREKGILVAGR